MKKTDYGDKVFDLFKRMQAGAYRGDGKKIRHYYLESTTKDSSTEFDALKKDERQMLRLWFEFARIIMLEKTANINDEKWKKDLDGFIDVVWTEMEKEVGDHITRRDMRRIKAAGFAAKCGYDGRKELMILQAKARLGGKWLEWLLERYIDNGVCLYEYFYDELQD